MWSKRSLICPKFLIGLVLVILVSVSVPQVGKAQAPGSAWSKPQLLFSPSVGYGLDVLSLVRDQRDLLYLWWPANHDVVYHTEWVNGRWSSPVDILVAPAAGGLTSAVVDNTGTIHAFSATDCVSYVSARYDRAMDPKGWSNRKCIDGTGTANVSATEGPDGTIYVVYAAPGTQTLRVAQSRDGGASWSISSIVSAQQSDGGFLADPVMAVDSKNRLHLVWTSYAPPNGYPPLGVFYARSDDAGNSWTLPVSLGRSDEGQPAIAIYGDQVHVLWNGDAFKKGRYYRYSKDGGRTWTSIEALTPAGVGGGLQRPPALIVDRVGHVHALMHDQEALSYMMKDEKGWTAKEPLYVPQAMLAKEIFAERLAITGGNRLNAVYILALAGNVPTQRVYYQYRTIDAPVVTPVAGFTEIPSETNPASLTRIVTPTTSTPRSPITSTPAGHFSADVPPGTDSPSLPLVASLLPAVLLISIVILVRLLGRR